MKGFETKLTDHLEVYGLLPGATKQPQKSTKMAAKAHTSEKPWPTSSPARPQSPDATSQKQRPPQSEIPNVKQPQPKAYCFTSAGATAPNPVSRPTNSAESACSNKIQYPPSPKKHTRKKPNTGYKRKRHQTPTTQPPPMPLPSPQTKLEAKHTERMQKQQHPQPRLPAAKDPRPKKPQAPIHSIHGDDPNAPRKSTIRTPKNAQSSTRFTAPDQCRPPPQIMPQHPKTDLTPQELPAKGPKVKSVIYH